MKGNHRHGHARKGSGRASRTYFAWVNMRNRCGNDRTSEYARYGGRGIAVCERWHVFANFLADMGEKPIGMSLDRVDTNGNYEPGNCRWATAEQQAQNRRSSAVSLDVVNEIRGRYEHGEPQASIGRRLGVSTSVVWSVVNRKTWRNAP